MFFFSRMFHLVIWNVRTIVGNKIPWKSYDQKSTEISELLKRNIFFLNSDMQNKRLILNSHSCRAFACYSWELQNSLLLDIRNADSVNSFNTKLKSYLFRLAFQPSMQLSFKAPRHYFMWSYLRSFVFSALYTFSFILLSLCALQHSVISWKITNQVMGKVKWPLAKAKG